MWFKGNNRMEFIPDFTVIDLETTGRGVNREQITELSAIKYRNYQAVDSFSTLIKSKQSILPFVQTLTGITNQMISSAPSIDEVIIAYVDFIDGDLIVGHNVNFDLRLVSDAYYYVTQQHLPNDYLDTLRISRLMNKDASNHKLGTLCEYFGIKRESAHRGLVDCEQTGQLYVELKNKALRKGE